MIDEKNIDTSNYEPKPGDSPNKLKMKTSKKYRPKKRSEPMSEYTYQQTVDPLQDPVQIFPDLVNDRMAPGQDVVGTIDLRPAFFTEVENMAFNAVDSIRDLMSAKMNFPDMERPLRTMMRFGYAAQIFETLSICNEEFQTYKMKALKHVQMEIPAFILPMIQAIGHFKAKEGTVRIRSPETTMLRLVQSAITDWQEDHKVADIPGYVNPNPTGRTGLPVWDTLDFKEVRDTVAKQFFNTLVTGDYVFNGRTVRVRPYDSSIDVAVYFDEIAAVTGDQALASSARDHALLLNCQTFGQFAAMNPAAKDRVGLYNASTTVGDLVTSISWLAPLLMQSNTAMKMILKTKPFHPSKQGSAAQFVTPEKPEAIPGMSSAAIHSYALSDSDYAKGFLLLPAEKVVFEPKHIIDSAHTRGALFERFARLSVAQH
jgi:hypothetical protein